MQMDNLDIIIAQIDEQIASLQAAKAALQGTTEASPKRGRPVGRPKGSTTTKKQRKPMSAEGRARIVAAQKARWAASKTPATKKATVKAAKKTS
ncbi:hypothetical protein BH10ACI4_BH10ACI4_25190 [soil metagenome]